MKQAEQILQAMGGIGDDLVILAEQQTFSRSIWQKAIPAAACLMLILGAAAALRQLPADPVRPQPAPETVLEKPAQKAEPDVAYTINEPMEDLTEEKAFVRELQPLPFYVFDPDLVNDNTPSKAIGADGTVLLEVESGRIEPLIDQATGEYLAISVLHYPEGAEMEDYYVDLYDLSGSPIREHLPAYGVACVGNVFLVSYVQDGQDMTDLYLRREEALAYTLQGSTAMVIGDAVWAHAPGSDGDEWWIFDSDGLRRGVEYRMETWWQDGSGTYVDARDLDGNHWLLDPMGNKLLSVDGYDLVTGVSNGYACCMTGETSELVELATGEVVFRCSGMITDVYAEAILTMTAEGGYRLLDWHGAILMEADLILPADDDADGQPELLSVSTEDSRLFLWANGEIASVIPPEQNVELITSRTAGIMQDWGAGMNTLRLLNLETMEEIPLEKEAYITYAPILEESQATGLLYAAYTDGETLRCDILREDGTVLIAGLSEIWGRQGDVFYTDTGDQRGLIRIDGTWIYRE